MFDCAVRFSLKLTFVMTFSVLKVIYSRLLHDSPTLQFSGVFGMSCSVYTLENISVGLVGLGYVYVTPSLTGLR